MCYFYPGAMARLAPKLTAEFAPGGTVLSHTFALPGWCPQRTAIAGDLYRTPVYLHQVPTARA